MAITALTIFLVASAAGQGCMSLFSYGANFETVTFMNQSTISNAHYWWNFGDGTGSYYDHPIHTFPETGTYLVTLFARDTVSGCADHYEIWVHVTKYSLDTCTPSITDSLFSHNGSDYLKIIDNSANCSGYNVNCDAGPAHNAPPGSWISIGEAWRSARFISRIQYFTYDTINGYNPQREAYKTTPYNYQSSQHYNDCSANFEFAVVEENSGGQRVHFRAMNKNALSYEWAILGFGNPIYHYTDTMSHFFTFSGNDMKNIGLIIEGAEGCRDTLYQQILIRPDSVTIAGIESIHPTTPSIRVFPNPTSDRVTVQSNTGRIHSLTVVDVQGKQVAFITPDDQTVELDTRAWPSGMYLIIVRSENERVSTRLVKQ